jgi:hypothetical protein
MVLSEARKFLFIHIPKAAGTSIRRALEPYAVTDHLAYSRGIDDYVARERQFPPHLTYAAAAKVLKVDLNAYYTFAFVRNPWDRYVSMYEYVLNTPTHALHPRCAAGGFDGFIGDVTGGRATFDSKHQIAFLAAAPGMKPVAYVGKMESIGEDFPAVCRHLGLPGVDLPFLNRTDHRPYRSYYSDLTRKQVERYCGEEIDAYGYAF